MQSSKITSSTSTVAYYIKKHVVPTGGTAGAYARLLVQGYKSRENSNTLKTSNARYQL